MTIQLLGEAMRGLPFQRGISQYPTVGDPVHLVTETDLALIYGTTDVDAFVPVGRVASAEAIPALININTLLSRHSAVVGTTGSGKSTTVAALLNAITDKDRYPSARVIVIDLHGEYVSAFRGRSLVYRISPDPRFGELPLFVPYWALTAEELLSVSTGPLDDGPRGAILDRITQRKRDAASKLPRPFGPPSLITADTPIPFSIHDLWFELHCEVSATHFAQTTSPQSRATWALELDSANQPVEPGDALKVIAPRFRPPKDEKNDTEKIRLSTSSLNVRRPLEVLAGRLRDPRFDFLFRPGPWTPDALGKTSQDLGPLLEAWVGSQHPITILDLSGVPSSVTSSVVGALLRIIYDALFWARLMSEGGRERPILVVLEEAHAYLTASTDGPASMAVRRIVKEGRKQGISAMLVSQRPSEIDATILSQCGTFVAMRLVNKTDRGHISAAVPDSLDGLMAMLPILRTGEALLVGEAVNLPMRALITAPAKDRRPDSKDPLVFVPSAILKGPESAGGWNRPREPQDYSTVVDAWRRQDPRDPRVVRDSEETP